MLLLSGIFRALSPHYLFLFFIRNGFQGWAYLGGTLLCITGTEAMYADMGHFSKTAIRVNISHLSPYLQSFY